MLQTWRDPQYDEVQADGANGDNEDAIPQQPWLRAVNGMPSQPFPPQPDTPPVMPKTAPIQDNGAPVKLSFGGMPPQGGTGVTAQNPNSDTEALRQRIISEHPQTAHPSWWRTALAAVAQAASRRNPALGQTISGAITERDPNVMKANSLMHDYAISRQGDQDFIRQKQLEESIAAKNATLAYTGMLRDQQRQNQQDREHDKQVTEQQNYINKGAQDIDSSASAGAPPPAPAPVQVQAPPPAPTLAGRLEAPPPTVSGGGPGVTPEVSTAMQANSAPVSNRIAGYKQVEDPLDKHPMQIPTLEDRKNTELVGGDLAAAAGMPLQPGKQYTRVGENERVNPQEYNRLINKAQQREENILGDRVTQLNSVMEQRWNLLNDGPMPEAYKLSPNATQKDYDRVDKALVSGETAKATQAQRDAANALREQAMAITREGIESRKDAKAEKSDKEGQRVIMGFEPSTGKTVATSAADAKQRGLQNIMDLPTADVSRVISARHWIPLATATAPATDPEKMGLLQLVDELDKRKVLGPIASRWNEFLVGKVGSGTGNPETDRMIAALRTKIGLSTTLLMNAHVGNRGGAWVMEHFEDLANAKKLNANLLRSGIKSELNYIEDRAMLPSQGGGATTPGGGSQKIATGSDVQAYANLAHVSPEAAAKHFTDSGYIIK